MSDHFREQVFTLCSTSLVYFDALVHLLRSHPWEPKLRCRGWMIVPSDYFFMMFTMLIFSYIGLFSNYHLQLFLRWNQCLSPAMMTSTNHRHLNLSRQLLLLLADQEEDNELFGLATGQPLPRLVPQAKFSTPVRHVPAPDASDLPMPSTMPTKSPLRSPPERTRRPRRSTKPPTDKEPADRRPSRSWSPMASHHPWTDADLNRLRDFKGNTTAKHSWKVIAGKLGGRETDRCEDEVEPDQESYYPSTVALLLKKSCLSLLITLLTC